MELWRSIRGLSVRPNTQHLRAQAIDDADETDWNDLDEAPPIPEELPLIAGTSCIIEYRKADGEESQRVVTCQRLDQHGDVLYLYAYCQTRKQVRQFRVDRVLSVCDVETGEQYASALAFFANYQTDSQHASQLGWGLSVRRKSDFLSFLNALVFLARCDREFHPLERQTLEQIVATCWIRMEYPGDPDVHSILAHVDRLAPDPETFWVAMHRCANTPTLLGQLKRGAREVVEADGWIADEEFYWGSRIDDFVRELRQDGSETGA